MRCRTSPAFSQELRAEEEARADGLRRAKAAIKDEFILNVSSIKNWMSIIKAAAIHRHQEKGRERFTIAKKLIPP